MSKNNIPIQVSSLDELCQFNISKIAAAIGVFDGIHLGHRKIIKELIKISTAHSALPIVITFFPHPRRVLYPDKPLHFLRTPEAKAKILGNLGIKAIVTIPFSLDFASLSPNKFIESFMHPHYIKLAGICVGTKWKFGSKAKGNEQTLHNFADKYGFIFKSVKEMHWNGKPVSSTSIREALSQGDFDSANYMLDKKYIITGHIIEIEKNNMLIIKIDYGVLPPCDLYNIYLNNYRNKELQAEVISRSELNIITDILPKTNKVEIEFIDRKRY